MGSIPALLSALVTAALLSACPRPAGPGTTLRPGGPRRLTFAFGKDQRETYQAKLLFQARMDQLGTRESSKHRFLATFVVTRKVTSNDRERVCFQDRFSQATVRIDNLPPRLTDAVAKELSAVGILWCLDRSGRLSMFSAQNMGPALRGLKLNAVLSRIYHMAASGSPQGKKLGDEWKQTTTNHQVIAGKQVQTDIQTTYTVMQSETCRPSPLDSQAGPSKAAAKTRDDTSKNSTARAGSRGGCLEVTITEQGVIPDFDMTKGDRSFKMGGVIKGKASVVVDPRLGSWRVWAFRRVVGMAATTKIRGASTDFGMRTDVFFLLTRKGS